MKLVFPNLELKEQYYDLVKSALRNGDISEMGNAYRENEKYEDMLIAGVPALYRITNGKITEFYFDSVEIEEFFNSMGRWNYGYKGNLKPYMVVDL